MFTYKKMFGSYVHVEVVVGHALLVKHGQQDILTFMDLGLYIRFYVEFLSHQRFCPTSSKKIASLASLEGRARRL